MNKDTKIYLSLGLIVIIIITGIYIAKERTDADEQVTRCMGENSVLYVQRGCGACEKQKEFFGKNYQYLNVIDCFYEREACTEEEISGTPTWIIDSEKYIGIHSIEQLKELTGC